MVYDMMEQVGTRQQQVTITPTPPPATDPSDPKAKKRKIISSKPSHGNKDTKPSRKVKASSNLAANDAALLELFPSRRNYPFGHDRTSDSQKWDFPRTDKSCRVLFKHIKKHGLGFVLDLELDDVQMDFLLVVSWKAFGGMDCSEKFYPRNSLQNVILPVFPFPHPVIKRRMETYYRQHLHGNETLRKNKRGETVKLTEEQMEKHSSAGWH
jgi:hypothetical protein